LERAKLRKHSSIISFRFLKKRKNRKRIYRDCGKGGSPIDIVYSALMYKPDTLDPDQIYILLDEDNIDITHDEIERRAKKRIRRNPERKKLNVNFLISKPLCIECYFLKLLNCHKFQQVCADCKFEFHNVFLNEKEKLDCGAYAKLFDQKSLIELAKNDSILSTLIKIMS
jgi:hypothetical protein